MATGQVLSLEPKALDSVGCLFLASVVSAEGELIGAPAPIAGMALFKEPVSTLRIASFVLVVAGIVGLKLSSAV